MLIVSGGVIGGGGFVLGLTAGDLSDAFLLGAAGAIAVAAVTGLIGGIKWLFHIDRQMAAITDALAEGFGSSSHERVEQHEAVLELARTAADTAAAAVVKVDENTSALAVTISDGFAEAKREREVLAGRLDRSIEAHETFTTAAIAVTLGAIERLDALDGKNTVADLKALIDRGGKADTPEVGSGT